MKKKMWPSSQCDITNIKKKTHPSILQKKKKNSLTLRRFFSSSVFCVTDTVRAILYRAQNDGMKKKTTLYSIYSYENPF